MAFSRCILVLLGPFLFLIAINDLDILLPSSYPSLDPTGHNETLHPLLPNTFKMILKPRSCTTTTTLA